MRCIGGVYTFWVLLLEIVNAYAKHRSLELCTKKEKKKKEEKRRKKKRKKEVVNLIYNYTSITSSSNDTQTRAQGT